MNIDLYFWHFDVTVLLKMHFYKKIDKIRQCYRKLKGDRWPGKTGGHRIIDRSWKDRN